MQKICKRCAHSAARASEIHEGRSSKRPAVRDVLAEIREKREQRGQALGPNSSVKLSIRDFVRAKASDFAADTRQLSAKELAEENYGRRVRNAFKTVSTREQLRLARTSDEDVSNYSSAARKAEHAHSRKALKSGDISASNIGQDESSDSAVPLQLFPGDLVEYWPDNSVRKTAIILRRPDDISGKRYHIIDERGNIAFVNPVQFKFVLHDFFDSEMIPKEGHMFQQDEVFVPMRQALRQFKSLATRMTGEKFEALSRIYDNLPTHLKDSKDPISSREICKRIFGDATQAQLYATCEALLLDRVHFLPDVVPNMSVPMFSVREPDVIEMLKSVTSWTQSKSPQYQAFIKHAQDIADYGTSVTKELDGPLTSNNTHFKFTKVDQLFLRFMRQACLERPERVNVEIYTTTLAVIVKDLNLVSNKTSDRRAAFECLKVLGVITPWEVNVNSLESAALPGFNSSKLSDEYANFEASTYGRNQVESLEKLGMRDRSESLRHDFQQLPVYAIDGENAAELDDGISLDGDWLHFHIADPASYIRYGSRLADMAEFRGMTSYMANRVFPMLPWELAMQHFSLGAKTPQPVMTTSVRLSSSGEVMETLVRPAVVRNIKKFTYEGVDHMVFGDTTAAKDEIVSSINWNEKGSSGQTAPGRPISVMTDDDKHILERMSEVLKRFRAYRLSNGALDFVNLNKEFSVQPADFPVSSFNISAPRFFSGRPGIRQVVRTLETSMSRNLVSESALLANSAVAKFSAERGIPIMYRVFESLFTDQDRAKIASIRDSDGRVSYDALGDLLSRVQAGRTSLEHGPAALLGLPNGYTFSTSPLRRFWDLTTQWQLQSFLLKEPYQADMQRILPGFARRENAMKRIGKATASCWTLQLLHQKLERGEMPVFEAIVSRNNSNPKFPSEGHIKSIGQRCQILREPTDPIVETGGRVAVTIDRLDLMDNVLYVRRNDL